MLAEKFCQLLGGGKPDIYCGDNEGEDEISNQPSNHMHVHSFPACNAAKLVL